MDTRDNLKRQILKRALVHVPFDGWSQEVLERAALEEGLDPSYGWRLFPAGPLDAVSLWSRLLDEEMLQSLPLESPLRITEKITLAVKTRLTLLIPHRETARRTAKFLSRPQHVGKASHLLYQTVNEMWYYAGDRSTDYNFYTKRGLLAWVYSTTFLYWLRDHSEGFDNTWAFLDHRIREVLALPKLPQKLLGCLGHLRRRG